MTHGKCPLVLSLPHCSNRVPKGIRAGLALNSQQIEASTDVGTAEIFGSLPVLCVLCAPWSRLTVDLNRNPDHRDAKGVVALVDYEGRAVYRQDSIPGAEEVGRRVGTYYHPYHERLRVALEIPEVKGLFDCHSLNGVGPADAPDPGQRRKDITLGNNGDPSGLPAPGLGETTCPAETLHEIKGAFTRSGFSVSLNRPYSGGFITTHYGRMHAGRGKPAVQIEINQALFCEPQGLRLIPEKVVEVRERVLLAFLEIAGRLF